jgi:hypothetical protein
MFILTFDLIARLSDLGFPNIKTNQNESMNPSEDRNFLIWSMSVNLFRITIVNVICSVLRNNEHTFKS